MAEASPATDGELLLLPEQSALIRFLDHFWLDLESKECFCFLVERIELPWSNSYTFKCNQILFNEIQSLSTKYDFSYWAFEICRCSESLWTICPEKTLEVAKDNLSEKNNEPMDTEKQRLPQ